MSPVQTLNMKIFLLLVLPIITIAQYSIIKGKNEYDELNFSPEKNEYVDASIIAISKHEFSIFVMDEAEHTKFIVFGQPTSYNKEYSQEKVTKYQRRNMHFYERNYLVLMNQHNDHPINITYDFIKRKKKIEPSMDFIFCEFSNILKDAVAEFFRDNWYWMLPFGIILGVPSFMCILCFTNLPGKNRTKIPGPMYVLCRYCWALFGNCIISLRKKWGKSNATNPPQTETYIGKFTQLILI